MIARVRTSLSGMSALIALPLCLAAGADAQTPDVELVGELTEELGNAAKISAARVVVGVALQGIETDRRPTVKAVFPREWAGDFACARWLTSDALYWAYGTYRLTETWKGEVAADVHYPTGKADAVGALSAEQMAVGITRGDCATESLEFVPALWNATYSEAMQTLYVLVNSRGADEVYVLGKDSIDVTCVAVREGSVGFDRICPVAVQAQDGTLELEVNRVRRGNPEAPVVISVAGVGVP